MQKRKRDTIIPSWDSLPNDQLWIMIFIIRVNTMPEISFRQLIGACEVQTGSAFFFHRLRLHHLEFGVERTGEIGLVFVPTD